jgi:type II secretory pathway component GspD/PulD (secretin)
MVCALATLASCAWSMPGSGYGAALKALAQSQGATVAGEGATASIEVASAGVAAAPRLFDIDSVDCEVADVLKGLARQSGTNIVVPSTGTNRITVELKQVSVEDAVRYITRLANLEYVVDNGTYIVGTDLKNPADEVDEATKGTTIATYRVNHVSCSELMQSLSSVFGEGVLQMAPGPASIAPKLDDTQTSSVTGVAASTLEATQEVETRSQVLIITGPKDVVAEALELCRVLDEPAKQVLVDVMITDISESALREMGVSWSWNSIQIREDAPESVIKFGKFTRASASIEGILSALSQSGNANLLANPQIAVLNGQKAFVLIGDRLLFPVLTGYTQAMTPIFDKAEERVGIYLQVAPLVADDGTITMTIYPQVSVVTDYLEVNGASYPQISTREAQTTIRVRSGDKIAIGGLIRDEEVTVLKKVPGLSEIPLFGELFKSRRKVHESSEVVIFLTPTILDQETVSQADLGYAEKPAGAESGVEEP